MEVSEPRKLKKVEPAWDITRYVMLWRVVWTRNVVWVQGLGAAYSPYTPHPSLTVTHMPTLTDTPGQYATLQ